MQQQQLFDLLSALKVDIVEEIGLKMGVVQNDVVEATNSLKEEMSKIQQKLQSRLDTIEQQISNDVESILSSNESEKVINIYSENSDKGSRVSSPANSLLNGTAFSAVWAKATKGKKSAKNRRQSSEHYLNKASTNNVPTTAVKTNNATTTISIQEVIIPESEKIDVVTARSWRLLLQRRNRHNSMSKDDKKRVIHWIKLDCLKYIWQHENSLEYSDIICSIDGPDDMLNQSDVIIERMVLKVIRPKSIKNFIVAMFTALQPEMEKSRSMVFTTENYHKSLYPVFCTLFDVMVSTDDLFRKYASHQELANMPMYEYGCKEKPGMWLVFLNVFNPHHEYFTKALGGVKELKKLNDRDVFLEKFKNINKELSKRSKQQEQHKFTFELVPSMEDILKDVDAKKQQSRFLDGKKFNTAMEQAAKLPKFSNGVRRQGNQVKLIAEEHYDQYDDETFFEDELSRQMGYEPEVEEADLRYADFHKTPNNSRLPKTSPKPEHSHAQGPCFDMLFKQVCSKDKDCKYSHDKAILEAKLREEIEKLINNPYCPKDLQAHYRKLAEVSNHSVKLLDDQVVVSSPAPLTSLARPGVNLRSEHASD